MLFPLSITIFICSLLLAGSVGYVQYGSRLFTASLPPASPTPMSNSLESVLNPTVTVDPALTSRRGELQTNLVGPLRQYYATRSERLAAIHVAAPSGGEAEAEKSYPSRVSLHILSAEGDERVVSFGYDLTAWNPSMLDNE